MRLFKKISLYVLVGIIVFLFVVLKGMAIPENLEAYAIPTPAIIAVVATCIVAGFIFYDWEAASETAEYIYNKMSESMQETYMQVAVLGSAAFEMSAEHIDSVVSIYRENIEAVNEFLKDGINGIYQASIEPYIMVEDVFGGEYLQAVNYKPGGGYYAGTYEFPEYDDLVGKTKTLHYGIGAENAVNIVANAVATYAQWEFYWNGSSYYYRPTTYEEAKEYFLDMTTIVFEGKKYYLAKGNLANNYGWPGVLSASVAVMAIGGVVSPYLVFKKDNGTQYILLYGSGVADYPIDENQQGRIAGGALPIDIQYGKTGVLSDHSISGSDVLSSSQSVPLPIDNPSSMLGVGTAGILAGDYTGAQTGDLAGTAAGTAATTWAEGYEGAMQEMDIPAVVIQKFPFCIPFDLAAAIGALASSPQVPHFEYNIPLIGGTSANFEVDFTPFQTLANIIKWFVLIIFNIGLIKLTRQLIRG